MCMHAVLCVCVCVHVSTTNCIYISKYCVAVTNSCVCRLSNRLSIIIITIDILEGT